MGTSRGVATLSAPSLPEFRVPLVIVSERQDRGQESAIDIGPNEQQPVYTYILEQEIIQKLDIHVSLGYFSL